MSIMFKNFSSKKNTAFLALLSCSALGFPNLGYAESLSAKTSWAISRAVSSSQGIYCTMAQRYSDDTILTIARNISGENSLAIDFKSDQFKKAENQSITIYPEGDASKTFNVKSKSDRAVVINLGADSSIIDRIAKTENLNVDINGKKINFSLTEFKAGQDEMSSCMEGIKSAPEVAKKLDPNDVLKRNVTIVKTPEVSQPTAETLLAAMPMQSSDINPSISEDKEREFISPEVPAVAVPSPRFESNNNEILTLKEENARLSRALSEQRLSFEKNQSSKNNAALNEIQAKLEITRSENEKLKQELSSIAIKSNEIDSSKTIESLKLENQNLQKEIAQLHEFKKADLNKTSNSTSEDEVIKIRSELRQLTDQSEVLKTENASLKSQIASLQDKSEGNLIKASGGNWDLEQSTRRYQESQREIVRLGALLQTQNAKCASEKKDIEYMLFDPAIANKAQISMLNSLEDEIKAKNQKLKLAEAQLASAKLEISAKKDEEINNLKKSIIQTKLEFQEKQKAATKAQDDIILSLKTEIDAKNKQLSEAQAKVEESKIKDATLLTKQQSLDGLKAELAQKNQQLAEAQAKVQDIEKFKGDVSAKDQLIATLKTDLSAKDKALAEVQAKVQLAESKVAEKAAEATKMSEQIAVVPSLQLQIQQANQKISDLQAEINNSKNKTVQASASYEAVPLNESIPMNAPSVEPLISQADLHKVKFRSMDEISTLLEKSGIDTSGSLKQVQGSNSSNYAAYSWKTNSLHGSIEMSEVSDFSQFDKAVDQYLSRAKTRCKGEFAAIPAPTEISGNNARAYEIACVDGSSSSSASVIFSYGDKILTTIAHEGRTEEMDLAIDARDKVASQLY